MPDKAAIKIRKPARSASRQTILSFVDGAFKDYLAARVLFLASLPLQAAVLGSTAIEKYLKALMGFRGSFSPGHLKKAHMRSVRNYDPKFFATLNQEFLDLLQKCYSLRYSDAVPVGFNAVVATREALAELDFTAIALQQKMRFTRPEWSAAATVFDDMAATKDGRLFADNYVLHGLDKRAFIAARPQLVYEVRRLPKRGLMEAYYLAKAEPSDGHFLRAALTLADDTEMQMTLAFEPVGPSKARSPDSTNSAAAGSKLPTT